MENDRKLLNELVKNKDFIVKGLKNFQQVLDTLHQRDIISESQKEDLSTKMSLTDSIRVLFHYIDCGNHGHDFMNVLSKTDNHEIANLLRFSTCTFTGGLRTMLKEKRFKIGSDMTLICELSDDLPVKWLKDNNELSTCDKYKVQSNYLGRQLMIFKLEEEDEGEYICECGSTATKCYLKSEGLRFIKKLADVDVKESDQLQLEFILNKSRQVRWTKDGEPLDRDTDLRRTDDKKFYKCSFTISNIQMVDSGLYCVHVEDLQTECKVTVQEMQRPFDIENARVSDILEEESKCKQEIKEKDIQIKEKEIQLNEKEQQIDIKNEEIRLLKQKLRKLGGLDPDISSVQDIILEDSQETIQSAEYDKGSDVEEIRKPELEQTNANNRPMELATHPSPDLYGTVHNVTRINSVDNIDQSNEVYAQKNEPQCAQVNVKSSTEVEATEHEYPTKHHEKATEDCKITITIAQQQNAKTQYSSDPMKKQEMELKETKEHATEMERELITLRKEKQELIDKLERLEDYLNRHIEHSKRLMKEMRRTTKKHMADMRQTNEENAKLLQAAQTQMQRCHEQWQESRLKEQSKLCVVS